MKIELKRQFYAWLLLAVFVPTMVAATLHIHPSTVAIADECSACVNHQPHAGHLLSASASAHDCVLCQLLGSSFIIASTSLLAILLPCARQVQPFFAEQLPSSCALAHGSRAPPVWNR